jgi:hypothetical protein
MRPLFFAIAAMLTTGAAQAAPVDAAEAHYQALLAAAKASAPNADWTALRLAYAARPGFTVLGQTDAKRSMLMAAEHGDCAAALPHARARLDEDYVDIDAHMVAAFCEETAGDAAGAKRDRDVGAGLVASVETGDGLSPAAAFTPIDVAEEYSVMRALGARVTQQSLIQQGGHSYDALQATDAKGRPVTYYFLIDRVLAAEAAALKPGDVSEGGPPGRSP